MTQPFRILALSAVGAAAVLALAAGSQAAPPKAVGAAQWTADGKMEFPRDYRTWVYLSSGMDMSYADGPAAVTATNHVFDNVFVDRAAYAHFEKTGTWPEGAVFVLEIRGATSNASINKRGQFQTRRLAVEGHVKDKARFESGWGFVNFRGEEPGTILPQTSACNVCHQDHAAVDTTFVQFYPTLMPIAEAKKTLSAKYLEAQKVAVK